MKVLQINSVCGVGSTGRIATDIHEILLSNGHESFIAYGRDVAKNIAEQFTIKIGTKFDNYSHVIQTRLFDNHGLGSVVATENLINEIERLNPDIIHLHNIHGYYLNYPLLFKFIKRIQIKVVWTLHDCWSFTGHCAYYDYINCEKWKTECQQCPQKTEYPKSIIRDNSKKNHQLKHEAFLGVNDFTIVTNSDWLANEVKKSFLKNYEIEVINNGVDLDVFSPKLSEFRKSNNLESKFIILGVANPWNSRKGLKYFVELASKINKNDIIVLVGLNQSQINNLPDNIIGLAKTNSTEELAAIYSSSDVFVNPTLEDTFPTTNIESLACGLPIITFNTGGSPEAVDEKTGLVTKSKDVEGLLMCIDKIRINGKQYYSAACRRRALDLFDKHKQFGKYIKIYNGSI
jgi:putative colanic acid biosynthesis glycosyltransferase